MKKFILPAALVVLGAGTVVQAQPARRGPNMFPTAAACNEALSAGSARFYEPKYFGLATRNPVNDADRVVVPLESDMCLEMLVVGGRQFVAQREGTLFRATKRADGSLALYARDDCGNPVYNVVLSAPVPSEPEVRLSEPILRHYEPPPLPRVPPTHNTVFVPVEREKRGGFCSSKKCRWTLVAIGGAAAGYAAWRYWPCPPGTVRR